MAINLCESFRALFYTPFYLPFALGTYEEEGVAVSLSTSPSLDTVAEQLREGIADVYWGGPMRIMVMRNRNAEPRILGFCEAVTRDPFFLMGSAPRSDFVLSDLTDLCLHSVSEVPTPWMCLQEDLRRASVDPDTVSRIADRTMAENATALRDGTAQVVQLFQPFAETLIREGAGHVWYAQAARGPCSYTTLYATQATLARREDELHRMTRAMFRAQKWLHAAAPADVAGALADFFPEVDVETFAGAVERYLDLGVWGRSPRLPRDGFERLRDSLVSGGLIESHPDFEDCVDNRFADAVMAEDPPPA